MGAAGIKVGAVDGPALVIGFWEARKSAADGRAELPPRTACSLLPPRLDGVDCVMGDTAGGVSFEHVVRDVLPFVFNGGLRG